ncbi:MAG: MarR family transcriptional regulator [Lachnospiraceae bacterium]|nr:MarR family transcriptional regulator [Lachnospiraceae bacterium]
MRDYEFLLDQMERIIHKYNQNESNKRDYGIDIPLTQTEIHLIAVIGRQPGIGVKGLAEEKGVTVGAASQMVRKLVQKGLVQKRISEESEARVELTLTDKGQICFEEHRKFHIAANKKWYQLLDQLDDSSYEVLTQIAAKMEEMLS